MSPLEFARTQLGVVEERGNGGIPYKRYALAGEDKLPWCARFVRWCYTQSHIKLPGNRYLIGNVATMFEELRIVGAVLPEKTVIEPGDIVFLRTREGSDAGPGNHVGIVESCGALTVNSIEGNWSNCVQRVTRSRASPLIIGYARWPIQATA